MTLVISENDPVDEYHVNVKPTVPVVCKGSDTCHLNIAIGNKKFSKPDEVMPSRCGIRFDSDNWNTLQSFVITGIRDQVQDGDQDRFIQLEQKTFFRLDHNNQPITDFPVEWLKLDKTIIRVRLRHLICRYIEYLINIQTHVKHARNQLKVLYLRVERSFCFYSVLLRLRKHIEVH